MSVYPSNSRLYKLRATQRELRLESLHIQHQFLDALCTRQRVWAKDKTNPEAAQVHARLADLMQEAATLIDHLLEIYRQDNHHHV